MATREKLSVDDRSSRVRPVAHFLLGCVVAGVCVAALEVLWTVLSPHLQIEALKQQALLPPPSIAKFIGSALILDVTIACLIGLVLLLPSLVVSRRKSDWALATGVLSTGSLLMTAFAVVWASLLSPGALFLPSTLVSIGATAVALLAWVVVLVAVVRTGSSPLRGAMRALTIGALVPLMASLLLHSSIPFPERVERASPSADLPNLILVTLDTVRADQLSPWSEESARTPTLARLAREGVLFERAMSPVPHTTPSHVSMFTSVYPFAHGARNGIPMRTNLDILPTELRKQGYTTAAIVSAYTTKSNVTGMGHAFDTYVDSLHPEIEWIARDDVEPLVAARLIDRFGGNQIAAPVINRRLANWLDRIDDSDAPFFLWLHYFDAHEPYTPTAEYAELYQPTDDSIQADKIARYRAEITYLDDQLGMALDQLHDAGLLEDALLVVTSDHGEAFGEPHPHIDTSHGAHLYDSVMWVPLIFWGPERIASDRRIREQVELLDIAPTMLDLIGTTPPDGFAGRTLSSVLIDDSSSIESARAFAQTRTLMRPRRFALRTSDWKLVVNPDDEEEELFDLRADPGETRDVSSEHPELVRGLREEIEFISRNDDGEEPNVGDLDPAALEHLKALGYIDD